MLIHLLLLIYLTCSAFSSWSSFCVYLWTLMVIRFIVCKVKYRASKITYNCFILYLTTTQHALKVCNHHRGGKWMILWHWSRVMIWTDIKPSRPKWSISKVQYPVSLITPLLFDRSELLIYLEFYFLISRKLRACFIPDAEISSWSNNLYRNSNVLKHSYLPNYSAYTLMGWAS